MKNEFTNSDCSISILIWLASYLNLSNSKGKRGLPLKTANLPGEALQVWLSHTRVSQTEGKRKDRNRRGFTGMDQKHYSRVGWRWVDKVVSEERRYVNDRKLPISWDT